MSFCLAVRVTARNRQSPSFKQSQGIPRSYVLLKMDAIEACEKDELTIYLRRAIEHRCNEPARLRRRRHRYTHWQSGSSRLELIKGKSTSDVLFSQSAMGDTAPCLMIPCEMTVL